MLCFTVVESVVKINLSMWRGSANIPVPCPLSPEFPTVKSDHDVYMSKLFHCSQEGKKICDYNSLLKGLPLYLHLFFFFHLFSLYFAENKKEKNLNDSHLTNLGRMFVSGCLHLEWTYIYLWRIKAMAKLLNLSKWNYWFHGMYFIERTRPTISFMPVSFEDCESYII